ncbi:general stress protein [Bacillus sp. JCM 19047]|uniref:pyridoxamine 5'-phosphate oxidase family protein n=1 Tax=Shouchella miscanthi TaxID=2598861 RepID=UPI0003EFD768|nr:pyridoxamine 5'-phosphate oxidase family protein [Shouchella miscanthi]GAF21363.1 general stress protein [Bacillus sp. JCM 19047]
MDKSKVKQQMLAVMEDHKIGSLSTVKENRPHSRYMTFYHKDFTLYTPTDIDTYKAKEVEENPHVHVLLGYTGEGYDDAFIEFQGTATIRDDQETKNEFWHDTLTHYFDSATDPSYILLELKPKTIRLMNKGDHTPYEISFD